MAIHALSAGARRWRVRVCSGSSNGLGAACWRAAATVRSGPTSRGGRRGCGRRV